MKNIKYVRKRITCPNCGHRLIKDGDKTRCPNCGWIPEKNKKEGK